MYSIICDHGYLYVCDHVRASVSVLFKDPYCPVNFCSLKSSILHLFIHSFFEFFNIAIVVYCTSQIVLLFDVQNSMESNSCQKVIVDCDAGVDDAQAIIMMLVHKHVQIIAITTVFGNEPLENTSCNAVRVLKLCNRLDVSCLQFLYIAVMSATLPHSPIRPYLYNLLQLHQPLRALRSST